MSRFLLHVGLPKCASTSLQAAFQADTAVNFLGKFRGRFTDEALAELLWMHVTYGDFRLGGADRFRPVMQQALDAADDRLTVLSDEFLSSVGFGTFGQSNTMPQIVDNLLAVSPQPFEIVLVIREQQAFLQSYFAEWINFQGMLHWPEFVELVMLRENRWLKPVLDYPSLVAALRRQVEHVHVLVFERLFSDPAYRLAKLQPLGLGESAVLLDSLHLRPRKDRTVTEEVLATTMGRLGDAFWEVEANGLRRGLMPDIHPNRPVRTDTAAPLLLRVGALEAARKTREDGPDGSAALAAHLRQINQRLEEVDPETDWNSLGYLR